MRKAFCYDLTRADENSQTYCSLMGSLLGRSRCGTWLQVYRHTTGGTDECRCREETCKSPSPSLTVPALRSNGIPGSGSTPHAQTQVSEVIHRLDKASWKDNFLKWNREKTRGVWMPSNAESEVVFKRQKRQQREADTTSMPSVPTTKAGTPHGRMTTPPGAQNCRINNTSAHLWRPT